MTFRYEKRFTFFLALALFGGVSYILWSNLVVTASVIMAISIVYMAISRRGIELLDDVLIVKGVTHKYDLTARYENIQTVQLSQIYSTTYLNIVVKIVFNIKGVKRTTSFDIDSNAEAASLVRLLRNKGITCTYSHDYLEAIIENRINTATD